MKLKRGSIRRPNYVNMILKVRNLIKSLFISGLSVAKKTHLKHSVETKMALV